MKGEPKRKKWECRVWLLGSWAPSDVWASSTGAEDLERLPSLNRPKKLSRIRRNINGKRSLRDTSSTSSTWSVVESALDEFSIGAAIDEFKAIIGVVDGIGPSWSRSWIIDDSSDLLSWGTTPRSSNVRRISSLKTSSSATISCWFGDCLAFPFRLGAQVTNTETLNSKTEVMYRIFI